MLLALVLVRVLVWLHVRVFVQGLVLPLTLLLELGLVRVPGLALPFLGVGGRRPVGRPKYYYYYYYYYYYDYYYYFYYY